MSPIRGTFSPSGDSMVKYYILGIFRLSCTFYYEKAHVKTSWEDTSPSRPKFNPLHQRNSPLRLAGCPVQFGTKYIFWASKNRKFMSKK